MAAKALNQMLRDAAWGRMDFLLLDLPPGTGDIHLSIIQEVPVTGLWYKVHLSMLHLQTLENIGMFPDGQY